MQNKNLNRDQLSPCLHFLFRLGFIDKEIQTSCGWKNVCVSQGRHLKYDIIIDARKRKQK